jgi:eukaryotic-like serine/threonine-protein kinase
VRTFEIGDVIAGKYEVTRVLGQGGMGLVVAAFHRDLHALVALKFLRCHRRRVATRLTPGPTEGTWASRRVTRCREPR